MVLYEDTKVIKCISYVNIQLFAVNIFVEVEFVIDESKVSLMTKITIYEEKEQHKAIAMSRYYKRDYVRFNVLKTWVASTVVYWTVFGSYIYMHFEDVLAKINEYDYFDIMYKLLAGYMFFCAIYFFFSSFLYGYRYQKAKPELAKYNGELKKLIALESGESDKNSIKVVDKDDMHISEQMSSEAIERPSKSRVNRMELMRKQQELEEKKKEQEIIENVRRRNDRMAARRDEMTRQQREAEEDRQRIRERRMLIERQQMEKLRNERMQKMQQTNRQDHAYHGDDDSEGGER